MSTPIIEISNMGVTYPNGHTALSGVNVKLYKGLICGLVGMNGAGKSTLFKSIMGFIKPTVGNVSIDGRAVHKALKKNTIAYVPQTEEVDWNFPVLVKDVVMMGRYSYMGFLRIPSQEDKLRVDEALERVSMLDYKYRQIGELSGGQKKRVFVARALAQGGEAILLDEPFTGVDIKTEEALIDLFNQITKENRLILVSTHNLGSVPRFCHEVMLVNKTLLAHGPVPQTFTQENLSKTFGGMLRYEKMGGGDLHKDNDQRGVTVLTDDERPLVLYGKEGQQQIFKCTVEDCEIKNHRDRRIKERLERKIKVQ